MALLIVDGVDRPMRTFDQSPQRRRGSCSHSVRDLCSVNARAWVTYRAKVSTDLCLCVISKRGLARPCSQIGTFRLSIICYLTSASLSACLLLCIVAGGHWASRDGGPSPNRSDLGSEPIQLLECWQGSRHLSSLLRDTSHKKPCTWWLSLTGTVFFRFLFPPRRLIFL